MAEREGFEPSVEETPYNRLAICPVRPLQHLSALKKNRRKVTKDVCKGKINGGGGGIRTHGPARVNGFQDRPIRPLSHPTTSPEKYRQAPHLCQAVCINSTQPHLNSVFLLFINQTSNNPRCLQPPKKGLRCPCPSCIFRHKTATWPRKSHTACTTSHPPL